MPDSETADATSTPRPQRLIAFFDSACDMAEPAGPPRQRRPAALNRWNCMIVGLRRDRLEDNLNLWVLVYTLRLRCLCPGIAGDAWPGSLGARLASNGFGRSSWMNVV